MTNLLARRAASLVLAAGVLLPAAPALADPAADFAPGTAAFQAADQIARDHWQAAPCGGQVQVSWTALAPATNASSTWTNPSAQYDNPTQNAECRVTFNALLTWDWTRFCSVLVHEYGHLSGHPHSESRGDVMFAFYEAPVAQCLAAAPAAAPVAAAASAAPTLQGVAKPRAVSASRSVKRAQLVVVHPRRHRHRSHRHRAHGHRAHRRQAARHRRQVLRSKRAELRRATRYRVR